MKSTLLAFGFIAAFTMSGLLMSFEDSRNAHHYSEYSFFDDTIYDKLKDSLIQSYSLVNTDTCNRKDEKGLKQGYWLIYGYMKPEKGYADSCLIEQGTYIDDRKNGVWVKYYQECNQPRLIGTYSSGRPYGSYTKFLDSGKFVEKGTYYSGTMTGNITYFHEDGITSTSYRNNSGVSDRVYISEYISTKKVTPYENVAPINGYFTSSRHDLIYGNRKIKSVNGNSNNLKWRSVDALSDSISTNDIVYYDNYDQVKGDFIPDVATQYERYNPYEENDWIKTSEEEKSTFSIDVDNASYTNFRRYASSGQLPPKDAIRLEEWLNYFNYDLEAPEQLDEHPLKVTSEIGPCFWAPEDDLLMIKIQGKLPPEKGLPPSNLVFLVDVSGSMSSENKLPLVKKSMLQLTDKLRAEDKITIVTYAGSWGVALKPTSGANKSEIIDAINNMSANGSTAGSQGINSAYKFAEESFIPNGNNRVIVATDGDWNVGITDDQDLKKLIEEKRKTGIYLSVLGYGIGNLNDAMMETLADNGNGNYAYIDKIEESERIFNTEFAGTMYTIAKDVKLQLKFDSNIVEEYRLIGYENRVLENWQFEADSIDAGDLGMGQNVVAFYQVKRKKDAVGSIGKLEFRYKPIDSDVSKLLSHEFDNSSTNLSADFQFASCVVEFAMCLSESEFRGDAQMSHAILHGRKNLGDENNKLSYDKRVEFVGLMESTAKMWEGYIVEDAPDHEFKFAPEIKLYPNPAKDYTTIEVPEEYRGSWSIQLFGMNGVLHKVQHFEDETQGRLEIDDLPPNTYIIKVYSGGYNFGYLRLVIQ